MNDANTYTKFRPATGKPAAANAVACWMRCNKSPGYTGKVWCACCGVTCGASGVRVNGAPLTPTYTPTTRTAVRLCAEALDYPCAERLQPVLLATAQHLEQHGHLALPSLVSQQLQQVSVSTVRRIVGPVRQQKARLAASRRPPRRRSAIARRVPMERIPTHLGTPGHFEVDTVHHNGGTAGGQHVYSLCWTDVATGWVATYATLGNSALVMRDAFQALWHAMPFPVREIHTDNGPEFLNDLIHRFLNEQQVTFTRSRPYRKNDNRFVEENNGSHIRAYVGYQRLDSLAQGHALNALYARMNLYHNLFQPAMRRQEDKTYTVAAPLARLLDNSVWDAPTCQAWRTYRDGLDLLVLRREIADALNALEQAPGAIAGQAEDVRQSIGLWKTGTTFRSASGCPPFPTTPTTATTAASSAQAHFLLP